MTWYGELLDWLQDQREHDEDVHAAFQEGWRRGQLAAGLQWPWLRRRDAVETAYHDGLAEGFERGVAHAERQSQREEAVA